MKLSNFFLPHPQTHKKAHLISWKALLFYILFFVSLQFGFKIMDQVKPGVLGISSSVDVKQLIELTNAQRAKNNLPALVENSELDTAAAAKAQNMFAEDYWAHYSPSGKDPWGFINGAGYKFTYAGENLARNFYTSSDVVNAWMASPSHKENIINSHYKDVGMAVSQGVLKGQQTILVVQEFGTPYQAVATKPQEITQVQSPPPRVEAPAVNSLPNIPIQAVAGANEVVARKYGLDPYKVMKASGITVMVMILSIIALDLYIIKRRGVQRLAARHLPHMALLALGTSALIAMHSGSIL